MKYRLVRSPQFDKDVAKCVRRGLDMRVLYEAMRLLSEDGFLPAHYKPHPLKGKKQGLWECHLKPDWLLVWERRERELVMVMVNTGSHSDLFKP